MNVHRIISALAILGAAAGVLAGTIGISRQQADLHARGVYVIATVQQTRGAGHRKAFLLSFPTASGVEQEWTGSVDTTVGDRLGITYDPRDPSVISAGRNVNTALIVFSALLSATVIVVTLRGAFCVITARAFWPGRALVDEPAGPTAPGRERRGNESAKKAARRRRRGRAGR